MITFLVSNLKGILSILIGLMGLAILFSAHEIGHLLCAKLFGVHVPSFSIGMGPVIASKAIGDTEYRLSAFPIGGYVEIAGQAEVGQGEQAHAHDTGSRSFKSKPYWQQVTIMLGGVFFNIILAFLIFIALFYTGVPQTIMFGADSVRPVISSIRPNSIASTLNLQPGDEIFSINNTPTPSITKYMHELQTQANNQITIRVMRGQELLTFAVALGSTGLGINGFKTMYQAPYPLLASIKNAFLSVGSITQQTVSIFASLFKKRSTNGLGGPLMIISILTDSAKNAVEDFRHGIALFALLIAFISINLAIINLIPLPITDGGQCVILTIEKLVGRRIPEYALLLIHNICWALFFVLLLYLTFKDAMLLFWPKVKTLLRL